MNGDNGTDQLELVDDLNREIGRAEAIYAAIQGMGMCGRARDRIAILQSDLVTRLTEINKRLDALRKGTAAG
jgi:hypothetical protein